MAYLIQESDFSNERLFTGDRIRKTLEEHEYFDDKVQLYCYAKSDIIGPVKKDFEEKLTRTIDEVKSLWKFTESKSLNLGCWIESHYEEKESLFEVLKKKLDPATERIILDQAHSHRLLKDHNGHLRCRNEDFHSEDCH